MRRIIAFIFVLLCGHNILSAAHIVGGDVTYACIESNPVTKNTKFRVTFTLFRDLAGNGAAFDNPARFGVYETDPGSNTWSHRQTIISNPINIQRVPYEDKCVIVPPTIIIDKANYVFDIELPWGNKIYQITYQRCCRNITISNIIDPGATGAAFYVEIFGNSIQECNNSPVFNKFPPILICNQKMLNFDHSASDSEGNRLEYEFCAPLHAGGTDGATTPGSPLSCTGVTPLPDNCPPPFEEVEFGPAYSPLNPMGGSPQISIDPVTGIITGVPNLQGQFVVGVCVKEFKNGIQIGSIRREFQFNVVNCQGISETKNYNLCEGDSILVNQTYYNQSGTYTQLYESTSGCDSTVNIIITGLKRSESQLTFLLCDNESVSVNGQNYGLAGTYIQKLKNKAGCDSLLNVTINKYVTTSAEIRLQLCDDETGIVNGIVYENAGNYSQKLQNINGCDSLINIIVNKGITSLEEKVFSLCDQNPITINGQQYSSPGKFSSQLTTVSGCDSTLNILILPCDQNIYYDLENCNALTPQNSMTYEEFLPAYTKTLECGSVTASNIYRDNPQMNKHSCTQGFNNSIAMCVSASQSCDINSSSVTPVVINFKLSPDNGYKIKFNHLIFQQMSPVNFNWISGPNGPNNYPTKYDIKIFKNNSIVYSKSDIPATNSWTREKYDFFDNDIFSSADSASYRIELLPYCPVGNTALVSVWDIDDVSLYFSCEEVTNRKLSGKIINTNNELSSMNIRRKYQHSQISANISTDGSYSLPKNSVDKSYKIEGYYNENTVYNVTTLDLVITQRHILGLQPFTSPLQYLAADVNNDKKVTAADLVQMRKIILGIDEYYKNNTSWIFLDDNSIKSATNPWLIKQYIDVPAGSQNLENLNFRALKVGDVDGAIENNSGN
ncbi:MAG: hypothetical protein IPN89_16640 [Saprospiraceae bacterium]|nr:hypothetical protein [Saprospiraceae bacterium]